jgi:hypothetical protein
MTKIYQVIMQDEYNNLYNIGFFDNLQDALPEINEWLSVYGTTIDELSEYPSTVDMCFDREIEVEDGGNYVYLRGFIFDKKALENIIGSLK